MKKLKDLKNGDRMWLWDFTDTTPIIVAKKKREGSLMTITLKWDEAEYECFGHALGWTCVAYNRSFGQELFTSDYETALSNEKKRSDIKRIGELMKNIIKQIDEL